MKNNIVSIEIEKETLYTVVQYKSGAVRWYNFADVPKTVIDVIRGFTSGTVSGLSSIVVRPFVTGDGSKNNPYQYKDRRFARIEIGA